MDEHQRDPRAVDRYTELQAGEVAGKDERRAERVKHVADRFKYGSATSTPMTAVKRVARLNRRRRRRPAPT